MNRIILIIVLFAVSTLCLGLTIQAEDYGFAAGKIRNYRQGTWNASATDLSEGTGKVWNLSTPNIGYINNSYLAVQNVSGFPSANIASSYNQYVNGINDSGTLYYQVTEDDINNLGYTASPNMVWNPAIPMGLPHYLGKTWQGTHSWTYGTYNVSGRVISEGTITTALGSFPAICVRYHYQTNSFSYDNYQWETEEYGISAYALDLNGGMLYVLNQAEPNVAVDDSALVPQSLSADISPNPFRDKICISLKGGNAGQNTVCIYNIRGQKLFEQRYSDSEAKSIEIDLAQQSLDVSAMPCGVYLLSVESGASRIVRRMTRLP